MRSLLTSLFLGYNVWKTNKNGKEKRKSSSEGEGEGCIEDSMFTFHNFSHRCFFFMLLVFDFGSVCVCVMKERNSSR